MQCHRCLSSSFTLPGKPYCGFCAGMSVRHLKVEKTIRDSLPVVRVSVEPLRIHKHYTP